MLLVLRYMRGYLATCRYHVDLHRVAYVCDNIVFRCFVSLYSTNGVSNAVLALFS